MKKLLALLLAGIMVFSFAGCGNKNTATGSESTENEVEEQEEEPAETVAPTARRLIVTKTGKFTNAEVQAKLKQVGLTSAVDKDGKIILAHVTDETSEHAVRPFIKRVVAAGFKAEIR